MILFGFLTWRRFFSLIAGRMRASMRQGDGVEIVEEGGDAAGVGLVHDRPRAAGGGDHVEAADALLDARDAARRHRQVAQTEAQEKSDKARIASHLAADADRHAVARGRLDGKLNEPQYRRVQWVVEMGDLLVAAVDRQGVLEVGRASCR